MQINLGLREVFSDPAPKTLGTGPLVQTVGTGVSVSCFSMAFGKGRAAHDDTGDEELIGNPGVMLDKGGWERY